MKPQRIQRKRTRGFKMPPNTVYVGRPTMWGNPFLHGTGDTHKMRPWIKELFREWIENDIDAEDLRDNLHLLRGKNLACWCPIGEPCHADVLIELANQPLP